MVGWFEDNMYRQMDRQQFGLVAGRIGAWLGQVGWWKVDKCRQIEVYKERQRYVEIDGRVGEYRVTETLKDLERQIDRYNEVEKDGENRLIGRQIYRWMDGGIDRQINREMNGERDRDR